MAGRQGDKLVAAGVKERIGGDRERGDVLLLNSFECYVELAIGGGPQDVNLQADEGAPRGCSQ